MVLTLNYDRLAALSDDNDLRNLNELALNIKATI